MCYELAKVLTNDKTLYLRSQWNHKAAKILCIWQQFEQSEVSFKAALNAWTELSKQDLKIHDLGRIECHCEYGILLKKRHKYHLAVEQFKLAFDIKKLSDNTKYTFIADCAIQIALCYRKLEDVENARKYYLKAIEIDDENTAKYCLWYANFLENLMILMRRDYNL